MTNEEIWKRQREAKARREAVPGALDAVRGACTDYDGRAMSDGEAPRDNLNCGYLRTLVKEVERLQAALKQANQDARDEEREARNAVASAYSEGLHDGAEKNWGH